MKKLTAEERAAKRAILQRETEAIIKASENKPKRKKSALDDEEKTEDKNDDVKDVKESSATESSDVAPDAVSDVAFNAIEEPESVAE
jgi:hypothetical protein